MSALIEPELLRLLVCPRDQRPLQEGHGCLACDQGHSYPVLDGVPVLLLPEKEATLGVATASIEASTSRQGGPLYLGTLGLSDSQRAAVSEAWVRSPPVDPVISHLVAATSGYAYLPVLGKMSEYPVPRAPLPEGEGRLLVDLGCSWGRWTISAARKGWVAVGLDPSLGALLAAKRAFGSEGQRVFFVCGDARALPFASGSVDCVYSYSVLQHFSESDLRSALREVGRILHSGGVAKVQMAAKWGLRSLYLRTRPSYAHSGSFRVRYWSLSDLKRFFGEAIGPCSIHAEAYGGLGLLKEDLRFLSARGKLLVLCSTFLRSLAKYAPPIRALADSVFVAATKAGGGLRVEGEPHIESSREASV